MIKNNLSSSIIKERNLLLLPLITYILSYIYIAFYKQEFVLLNTIIHESGKYSMLEVVFFASHFIGHIPIYTVLALYYVGIFFCFTEISEDKSKQIKKISLILVSFLTVTLAISLYFFSYEDTIAFLLQQRQRPGEYNPGGSWNLHLPSTLAMFFLIPVYIFLILKLFKRQISLSLKGINLIYFSTFLTALITIVINYSNIDNFISLWTDPRYQGHSLRELATYSMTYLSLPMYFFIKKISYEKFPTRLVLFYLCLLILVMLVGYQFFTAISVNLKQITQIPDFAKGENLSIGYLLASHYFEHFLDSIYFTLICLFFFEVFSLNAIKSNISNK